MNPIALILSMTAATYSTRIAGFMFHGRTLPDSFERFLGFVPIAAFAALVATGLDVESAGSSARTVAVIPAAIVALRWNRLWLTLGSGMAFYWLAGLIL